ncbi:TetR family transcriptional regulator [Pararhizobium sp. IMCC21322]|uniref:TetR family transcriptional regulator n=1 Tax=Pararhizobium sp. IMCC21322 TaxID=3067903 RepID=UPI0027405B51|nr:TetR family transcriptional regulator [Pararhizobium sp. IMCC21322]
MSSNLKVVRKGPKRDAAASKRRILEAALHEFSRYGHAGARMDSIAEAADVSKPMIYTYYGDKEELYKAALRESYVQIRRGELNLQLGDLDPEAGIRELVSFTMNHFVSKPWFISMLNTENLLGGDAIRQIGDADAIQSPLIDGIGKLLQRGASTGLFRDDIDPVELYITIASLCYFPVSNQHTLRSVFKVPIDAPWLAQRSEMISDMVVQYLRSEKATEQ